MPSITPAKHIWSPKYRRHMEENHSNGVTNDDMATNLLQTQLKLCLIREEFQDQLCEFQHCVNRDLDAMNREVDDIRVGQLDISNLVADLKNHFVSLQGSYVKKVLEHNKHKKVKYCVGIVGVVTMGAFTFMFFN
ncbi:unnamed protein product [Lactuca virosa]|uniref:t-SNARE coiled-coil homology domain-containing protein n=1 Tax=Lactuca virosa TaxID=75947 RepID=A0AAU9PLX6_9ASTR|nr:unnamed protein product [Lactuca virosa]